MLKLRPLKRSDLIEIVSWVKGEKEFYRWSIGMLGAYLMDENGLYQYFMELMQNDQIYQMVACIGNVPVGYVTICYEDDECMEIDLGFIIVDPKMRKKGYGKKMIRLALHYAFDLLKIKRVSVSVFENNEDAYQCYLHTGFSEVVLKEAKQYAIGNEIVTCKQLKTCSVKGQELKYDHDIADESIIEDIIKSNGFFYAYQPIVSALTGDIYGYEALMRTKYGKQFSPDVILQYAAKNNMLHEIEYATFYNVLSQIKAQESEFKDRVIFINSIPGYQLSKKDYEYFYQTYREYFHQCVLEITEATQLPDEELRRLLKRSKADGFELAIDDYGTGYSNTTNLLRNIPKYVKIDHLLISNIHGDAKKQHFVKSLIEFGHENGILILAEGVENSAELKCVVQLGIDLIQGFYTARPSAKIRDEIDPTVKNEIINAHVRGQTQSTRNVYIVKDETELPLMRVALEQNTGIIISQKEFTLIGNPNYTAAMSVKIKDGCTTKLTLRNVLLESFQDIPCIELGENVDLTIMLEGNNHIRKVGICVPDSSRLRIEGEGNLFIHVLGIQSYAIGNLWDAAVGNITFAGVGKLHISVESDESIGIGGGHYKSGSGIEIMSGKLSIESASGKTIGIGCVHGNVPIKIHDCDVKFGFRIDYGIGIGAIHGIQDTLIYDCSIAFAASGNTLCAIGSVEEATGEIVVERSNITIIMNGQQVKMLGSSKGSPQVSIADSTLDLRGEGTEVMVLGTKNKDAKIHLKRTNCNVIVRSGQYYIYGAKKDETVIEDGHICCHINE